MPPQTLLLPAFAAGQSQITTDRSIPLLSRVGPAEPCGLCRVKSKSAGRVRLLPGVYAGEPGSLAFRCSPFVTAVVRWFMPQICPKPTAGARSRFTAGSRVLARGERPDDHPPSSSLL